MSDIDSDIDPEEYKLIFERLKKRKEERQRQNEIRVDSDDQKVNQKRNKPNDDGQSNNRKNYRPRHIDRQRSRDNQRQNIRWHIYEEVQSIDYIDSLPEKLRKLPIFKKKDQILEKIIKNQVVLVTGDTGCGKSTQVPRLIYEYLKKIGQNDKIICVQPRRLAVTSLKAAVQSQLNEKQRVVGYQIGQKAEFNAQTRIVFMTNGIFLQRIIHDTGFLNEYPFVVLDEVHERDIDTDFILTAIKRIIRQFPKVRIILMSATIDNELFRYYFASDHIDKFMEEDNFYKKIIELEEYEKAKDDDDSSDEGFTMKQDSDAEEEKKRKIYDKVAFKFLDSKFPCPAININQPSNFNRTYYYLDTMDKFITREHVKKWGSIIWSHKSVNTHKELFETACVILDQIRHNNKNKHDLSSQAVLVFLPGLNEIENFSEDIFKFLGGRQKVFSAFELVHVHSTIMNEQIQQKINTPNKRQIKVIISTNIAESSITVKGVKYVIDFCLTKEIRFDERSKMENLELVWSSKASCKQRAGRTGRVCDGYIFRMVEKNFYEEKFDDYSEPEIKRSSLDRLILRIKLMHEHDKSNLFADPPEVLGTCIQPPKLQSIQSAINSLKFCGGLQQQENAFNITQLGKLYVEIPIDITYTKFLIVSMLFGTFYDALILVSILSQNKSPIHRRQIEKYSFKYFDQMSNYEQCDFLALVNMFKDEDQFRNQQKQVKREDYRRQRDSERDYRAKSDRLKFSIYTQTKNSMDDILKRLQRKFFNLGQLSSYLEFRDGNEIKKMSKKCHEEKHPKPKYTDYFMRWKLTLAFGFVDKMILIKPPLYDPKQEKRLRDMQRFNISSDNTVVLLNSTTITLPRNSNKQIQEKTINHWKNVFRKSMNINIRHITLTSGLNYLHFEDQVDLNKLMFLKYMDSNIKRRGTGCVLSREDEQRSSRIENSGSLLTVKQVIECLGDIDHMQQGRPVTLFKENHIIIDQYSLNRVCNFNEHSGDKYLITNSFMLQNKNTLTCRYTSALNIFSFDAKKVPNTVLHVLSNILFYPFVKLKANKKQTGYEYLALKKKYMVRIPYSLTEKEIEDANLIRELIKEFFQLKRPLNSQNCSDFYKLVRQFVCKKRTDILLEKDEEIWQNQFLNQLKNEKIHLPQVETNKKASNPLTNIPISIPQKNTIIEQANENIQPSQQKEKMTIDQLRNILQSENRSYETRNFMNPIQLPTISAEDSFFLRPKHESAQDFKKKMKFYLDWKVSKLTEVQELTKYALDNDTYLCCGQISDQTGLCCELPLCKLKRVGALDDEEIFRDLFQPITDNMMLSSEESSQIDDFLYGQNYQKEYVKYCCKNGHQIGIKIKVQTKVKIMILKQFALKYPDFPYSSIQQADFSSLDMKDWAKQEKTAIQRKQKKLLSTSCYLCASKISTYKQLRAHVQDPYHIQAIEKFKKSIEMTRSDLQSQSKVEEEEEIQFEEKQESNALKKKIKEQPMEIEY